MELVLTEEQRMLQDSAREWVRNGDTIGRLRQFRDEPASDGSGDLDAAAWKQMGELGWHGIALSEQSGGAGLGLAETVAVTEALGAGLTPEPYIPCSVLAGRLLDRCDTGASKSWVCKLAEGQARVAVGFHERGARFDLSRVSTTATRSEGGWILHGQKAQVWGGTGVDAYVVPARVAVSSDASAGIALFLVEAGVAGMTTTAQTRVDGQNTCLLGLEAVQVSESACLADPDRGLGLLEVAVDDATVALCGEMLGGAVAAFEQTLTYLKERKQFDTIIGSFQALKHRAARMFIELELARSSVMAAARAIDEGATDARQLVSLAKARCSDTYMLIANEAIQLHGGIGMTDEHDIGFYLKRARAAEMTFGDAGFHRQRFATLSGY